MKIRVVDITKGNALDLRDWLIEKIPDKPQTINKIFSALRAIFTEYIFRDELRYNPFALVGKVNYTPKEKELLNPGQLHRSTGKVFLFTFGFLRYAARGGYGSLMESDKGKYYYDKSSL